MSDVILSLSHVDKFFGNPSVGVHAVQDFSMDVKRGEIIALLGSSGCGKTSTLRMIAGFESVSRGAIELNGRAIHTLPPAQRGVAMAFEGYALYPPLTVRDNIGFALRSAGTRDVAEQVTAVAKMLNIQDILDRYPSSISSGQQQRVSLARALIRKADLHLLDEPMGQLEPQLRTLLRGRIKHFMKAQGLSTILVTHDQTEAIALADRIAVMEGGILQQYDTAENIKNYPTNLFTGTFIGEPPMNVFNAAMRAHENRLQFHLNTETMLDYPANVFSDEVQSILRNVEQVIIGVRPYIVTRTQGQGLPVRVETNQWIGDQSLIITRLAEQTLVMIEHKQSTLRAGETITIELDPDHIHIFDAQNGKALVHGREHTS
ncbi:MAG: ABC transporter ATP-binding protein [Pseudomonadota bacterium]